MYNFKYHKPSSLEECINLFKKTEFQKYLSGGMTLIPSMKQLLSSPTDLIDIQNIKEILFEYKHFDGYKKTGQKLEETLGKLNIYGYKTSKIDEENILAIKT